MSTLIDVLLLVLVVVAVAAVTLTLRREGFSPEGWLKVRQIVYQAIEDGMALYQGQDLPLEQVIKLVSEMVYRRLQESQLPAEDKRFWTMARIEGFIAPVITELLAGLAKPGA